MSFKYLTLSMDIEVDMIDKYLGIDLVVIHDYEVCMSKADCR